MRRRVLDAFSTRPAHAVTGLYPGEKYPANGRMDEASRGPMPGEQYKTRAAHPPLPWYMVASVRSTL